MDACIRSRFDQQHKLPTEKRNLLGLRSRKFRISARHWRFCEGFGHDKLRFSRFFFALSISLLLSDQGKCLNSHFALTMLTMLTHSQTSAERKKTAQNEAFDLRPTIVVLSAPRSAEPNVKGNETGRPTTRLHLFVWCAKASTCWPGSPACESVNNQTSGREPQKCVGVTASKPFSMMTGLQSRLLATAFTLSLTCTLPGSCSWWPSEPEWSLQAGQGPRTANQWSWKRDQMEKIYNVFHAQNVPQFYNTKLGHQGVHGSIHRFQWGQGGLCHGIQKCTIEAILACHPAYPQNDWTGWQNGVNDDVRAHRPHCDKKKKWKKAEHSDFIPVRCQVFLLLPFLALLAFLALNTRLAEETHQQLLLMYKEKILVKNPAEKLKEVRTFLKCGVKSFSFFSFLPFLPFLPWTRDSRRYTSAIAVDV